MPSLIICQSSLKIYGGSRWLPTSDGTKLGNSLAVNESNCFLFAGELPQIRYIKKLMGRNDIQRGLRRKMQAGHESHHDIPTCFYNPQRYLSCPVFLSLFTRHSLYAQ